MPTLADLANFDAGSFINAGVAGQKQRTLADIGQAASTGDFRGAQAAAFAGGENDIGLKLKSMNDQDKMQLVEQAASWAYDANDPQKWEAGRAMWQAKGFDPGPFQARNVLISQAQTVQQKMAQANADRSYALEQQKVAQAGAGGGNELGVTPIYGVDAKGNTVILQTGKSGRGATAQFPEGVRPLSPTELNQQKAYGTNTGKYDANKPQLAAKASNLLNALDTQWQTVDQDIGRALESINSGWVPRTGLGAMAAGVPGTPQYDLAQLLETIKANIGFDKLQEMRTNSPTGGALGQVSDFENKLLQAVRGSLQQGQSADQLKANLERVRKTLADLKQDRYAAYKRDFGDVGQEGGTQAAPPPPGGPGPVDWQSYFGNQ